MFGAPRTNDGRIVGYSSTNSHRFASVPRRVARRRRRFAIVATILGGKTRETLLLDERSWNLYETGCEPQFTRAREAARVSLFHQTSDMNSARNPVKLLPQRDAFCARIFNRAHHRTELAPGFRARGIIKWSLSPLDKYPFTTR